MYIVSLAVLIIGGLIAAMYSKAAGFVSSLTVAAALVCNVCISIPPIFYNNVPSYTLYLQMPMGIVNFDIDSLSAFFLITASIIFFITSIYLNGYMPSKFHFAFFNFLFASVMIVLTVKNSIGFLISLELVSLLTMFLIFHEYRSQKVQKSAVYYLIAMHVGTVFLIIPVIILIAATRSMDFSAYKDLLASTSKIQTPLLCLFLLGFIFKAGFVPFHTANTTALSQAPPAISAVISAVVIQIPIYGILRISALTDSLPPFIAYTFLFISVITALYAVTNALTQKDLKQILSYSTVANIGIIGVGISVGLLGKSYGKPLLTMLGFTGVLFHIFNSAVFMSTAFFACGSLQLSTGTSKLTELGGVIKNMPVTALCFLAASLSICALPPFNGFISEFFIYLSLITTDATSSGALITSRVIAAAALASVGALSLIAYVRAFSITFTGVQRSQFQAKESPISMIIPMAILSVVCLIAGIFPMSVTAIIKTPVLLISGVSDFELNNAIMPTFSISKVSLIFLMFVIAILGFKHFLLRKRTTLTAPTWNCGYENVSSRMQYTASSLTAPLINLILPLVTKEDSVYSLKIEEIDKTPVEDTDAGMCTIIQIPGASKFSRKDYFFPHERFHYQTKHHDFIDQYIVTNILKVLNRFYDLFAWIQTGHIGHYLFYMLITLVLFLVISVWRLFW
ncbi:proton-conducting transporter transmembrane domain-containing protein [Candidatus Magnetomonas plexicatena]|uniref:proton-conducting transporter transmembrane domain-containing protein n=1 Tax=Candidatus Magnetomonas plexicatena TaxID=2552947 RepID=UPI00110405B8|nr:hypothetical protein E2O03_015235 [Nitrospirales bacterium LBB_01]